MRLALYLGIFKIFILKIGDIIFLRTFSFSDQCPPEQDPTRSEIVSQTVCLNLPTQQGS